MTAITDLGKEEEWRKKKRKKKEELRSKTGNKEDKKGRE
jgi:hypothetical protein